MNNAILHAPYTLSNLSRHNVMRADNLPFVFVHRNHPVVLVMQANAEAVGFDPAATPLVDNVWYKMSLDLFDTFVQMIAGWENGRAPVIGSNLQIRRMEPSLDG